MKHLLVVGRKKDIDRLDLSEFEKHFKIKHEKFFENAIPIIEQETISLMIDCDYHNTHHSLIENYPGKLPPTIYIYVPIYEKRIERKGVTSIIAKDNYDPPLIKQATILLNKQKTIAFVGYGLFTSTTALEKALMQQGFTLIRTGSIYNAVIINTTEKIYRVIALADETNTVVNDLNQQNEFISTIVLQTTGEEDIHPKPWLTTIKPNTPINEIIPTIETFAKNKHQ